jgi:CYTH domain-containing protein
MRTRLITSIYLPEEEFAVLAASLPGVRIKKLRHRLQSAPDVAMHVDEFQDVLEGLIMVEAEFRTATLLAAFPMPDFAYREVTDDRRFTGGCLVKNGQPKDLQQGATEE